MRVLVACEFSGIVRDAFRAAGHYALSADLEESERPGNHYRGDVRDIMGGQWDMMVAFPPCTYLARSGAHLYSGSRQQWAALAFVSDLLSCGIPRIIVENPIGAISRVIRKPDQIIQPWQFGHGETKATCLWLHGVPKLAPTCIVDGRSNRIANMPQRASRQRDRSRTYPGIAEAMATQWGSQ